jgi:hypothetical protein
MRKMVENPRQKGWLSAIAEAATEEGISLPQFNGLGMGSARSEEVAGGRYITFKRRLVPASQAEIDGIEWTLWQEHDDLPTPIAAFRDPTEPKQEYVKRTLSLLKGWLVDGWTRDEAKLAVGRHPGAQVVEELARPSD